MALTIGEQGDVSFRVSVGPPDSEPHACDVVELVMDAAVVDEIRRILESGSPVHAAQLLPCLVGVHRRRR
jgi:hypothetical protein